MSLSYCAEIWYLATLSEITLGLYRAVCSKPCLQHHSTSWGNRKQGQSFTLIASKLWWHSDKGCLVFYVSQGRWSFERVCRAQMGQTCCSERPYTLYQWAFSVNIREATVGLFRGQGLNPAVCSDIAPDKRQKYTFLKEDWCSIDL